MTKQIKILIVLTLILIVCLAVFAKMKTEESIAADGSDTIAIFGYVTDDKDNPLKDVFVGIIDYEGKQKYNTKTNEFGYYSFSGKGLDKNKNYYVYYGDKNGQTVEEIRGIQYNKIPYESETIKKLEIAYLKSNDASKNNYDIKDQLEIVRSQKHIG